MDRDLADILELCDRATPAPWYVINADDTFFMGFIGVATDKALDGASANEGNLDPRRVVAATLVQGPVRYASLDDRRWDENAEFIAAARDLVPKLVEEVAALRQRVRELEGDAAADGARRE